MALVALMMLLSAVPCAKRNAATVTHLIILGASAIFLLVGIVGNSFALKRFKAIKAYEQQQSNTYN